MTPTWFNTPARIVALQTLASTICGTPFFANSEAPGRDGGMDCVRLLHFLDHTLGVLPRIAIPRQTMDHGQHSTRSLLIEAYETWPEVRARYVRLQGEECSPANLLAGDKLCFHAGKVPHHGACMVGFGTIIHTLAPAGAHMMQLGAAVRGERILGKLAAVFRPLPETRA